MPFPDSVREVALVKSHRRCCVCHDFAGRSVTVHHIIQEADDGANALSNAIVLCLRCHAEAGHFNPRHPLGTKYSVKELIRHRDQWWDHCAAHPDEPILCGVDISFANHEYTTKDRHVYCLQVRFTNHTASKQAGYVFEALFPKAIPVTSVMRPDQIHSNIVLESQAYTQYAIRSDEVIYRGQTVQIIDQNRSPLLYEMNDALYHQSRNNDWQFHWNFYLGNMPEVRDVMKWKAMHRF